MGQAVRYTALVLLGATLGYVGFGNWQKREINGAASAFQSKVLTDTLTKRDTLEFRIPLEEVPFRKNFPKNPEYQPFPPNYKPKNNEAPKKKENEERMWPDIYNV